MPFKKEREKSLPSFISTVRDNLNQPQLPCRTMKTSCLPLLFVSLCSILFVGCASNPERIRREMTDYTNHGLYNKARNVSVKHNPGGIPKTEEERVRDDLILTMVNPAEITAVKGRISSAVNDALAKRDYDGARDAIWTMGLDLVPGVAEEVDPFKAELLREKVNIEQYVDVTNGLAQAVHAAVAKNDFKAARNALASVHLVRVWPSDVEQALNGVKEQLIREKVPTEKAGEIIATARTALSEVFRDSELRRDRKPAGADYKPDEAAFQRTLETLQTALKKQGCPEDRRDKLAKEIAETVAPVFRTLWRPAESIEDPTPRAIGTSSLNALITEARRSLYNDVVIPAQIAFRAKDLRNKIMPLLDAKKLEEARIAIYEYGITGYDEVDIPVFAVKLGLLNAHVNPATLTAMSEQLSNAVNAALDEGNFTAASDAIAAIRPVPSYSVHVDAALDKAASGAISLGVSNPDVTEVVSKTKETLYDILAPRPDAGHDRRVLAAYARELTDMESSPAELDWSTVRTALEKAASWLVVDDMTREEANRLMNDVLAAFQSLAKTPSAKVETMTTAELNRRLADLKAELSAKVSSAVAEKLAAEAAAKAAADAAAAADEAEKMRALALEMAERAAAAVDFDARIAAFVEAVGDRVEPDMNRILGDGARVLRLRRAGSEITQVDASSLLVAAVYMGFDDVMNLALTLGADIDAPSPKDALRRPALLVALQYGWRGHAAAVLAKADRSLRDARGQGVVHYAVHGGNGSALVELLRADADTRTPDADGVAPLELAADLGYAGLVQALLPFADPGAADKKGFTALLRAAEDGRLDIVRLLVSANTALLDARTADGDGALELAALANAPDLLAYLLDERRIAPTERGTSQMVIAGNVPTLRILVAHGARLIDAHLAAAVKLGDFPMVKYLVAQGMDVNADVVKSVEAQGEIAEFLADQGQRR